MKEVIQFMTVTDAGDTAVVCMFCSQTTFRTFDTGEGCCDRCAAPIVRKSIPPLAPLMERHGSTRCGEFCPTCWMAKFR